MGARIDARDGRPPLTIDGGACTGLPTSRRCRARRSRAAFCSPACTRPAARASSSRRRRGIIRSARSKRSASRVDRDGAGVEVAGGQRLSAQTLPVPGDISGAAFWAALAGGTPGADVHIDGVGLNPSRIAVLDVLRRAGAGSTCPATRNTPGSRRGPCDSHSQIARASASARTKCRA